METKGKNKYNFWRYCLRNWGMVLFTVRGKMGGQASKGS